MCRYRLTTSYRSRGRVRSQGPDLLCEGFFEGVAVDPDAVVRAVVVGMEDLRFDLRQDELLSRRPIPLDLRLTASAVRDWATVAPEEIRWSERKAAKKG